jgi:hypothetical protein
MGSTSSLLPPPGMVTPADRPWRRRLWVTAFCCYLLSSVVPVLGVMFGHHYIPPLRHPLTQRGDLLASFATWDGQRYKEIITRGYSYDPKQPSNVAFFPAYPLLAWLLAKGLGLRPEIALLLVTHVSLAAAFLLLTLYVQGRTATASPRLTGSILLAFGLWPTTCFFRFAYSESLFLCCCLLVFVAMQRRWPLLLIAPTTATRPVGVALLLPFLLHLKERSRTTGEFLRQGVILLPLACWGLAAYMTYQGLRFGDPLVFAKTQANWKLRPPVGSFDKVIDLLGLEPIWGLLDPTSPCCWSKHELGGHPLFSLHLANALFLGVAVVLLFLGAWTRWLTVPELTFSAALLLIPYVTRSHEMCLAGMGRFAATAFPLYIVMGQILRRWPRVVSDGVLVISSAFLLIYAALFASWHRIF